MSEVLFTSDDFLPEGKLIRTIHGGEDTLKKSLIKLKKYEFTGYVKSTIHREGSLSEGYLIIKNGIPSAAVYGKRTGDIFQIIKQGEKALKLAWVDSYDDKCQLEVRGRVEVDDFVDSHPDSSITVIKKSSRKLKAKAGLSWGDKNKEDPKPKHDKELKALKKELEEWRSGGLVVHSLEESFEISLEEAEIAFSDFRDNIKKVDFFKDTLEGMDTIGHNSDVKMLEALFKNPMKITAIEAAMEDLRDKIELLEDDGLDVEDMELSPPKPKMDIPEELLPEPEPEPELEPEKDIMVDDSDVVLPELKPAGRYGEIMPKTDIPEKDKCGICGGDMKGLNECSICGAVRKVAGSAKDDLDNIIKTKDTGLFSNFTFSNFVVGENNRFSQAAALAVSKAETTVYNPLLICSGAGLGKTHIINAIGNYVVENNDKKKILYITTEKFMQEFIEATKSNKLKAFRGRYRKIDILLLDDIQFIADQEAVQDELFHTFNTLHKDGKQIVMTSDCPLKEISGLKDRLVSRFESGLVTDIQKPDLETRISILKMKSEAVGFVVGDDVLKIIARLFTSNIRLLEGALNKIIAYCDLMSVQPTQAIAEEVLGKEHVEPPVAPKKPQEEEIFEKDGISAKLKISHSYLIEEDRPDKCFELFVETLDMGFNGMCISRTNPKRLRGNYDFGEADLLWLTDRDSTSERTIQPALEKIIYSIEDLLNTGKKGILLIDGLEYLISNSNFDAVLRFLRRLIDDISESNSTFIMSLTPGTLAPQDLKVLEREMEVLVYT